MEQPVIPLTVYEVPSTSAVFNVWSLSLYIRTYEVHVTHCAASRAVNSSILPAPPPSRSMRRLASIGALRSIETQPGFLQTHCIPAIVEL